ncbi:MAG: hypothetical protein WD512_19000 [Candidatus Paceibacterota bacterium]
MKVFKLEPAKNLDPKNNPWEPWYEKTHGFIIRAETESEARRYADQESGNESSENLRPWLNQIYSTCKDLAKESKVGVIMTDFATG